MLEHILHIEREAFLALNSIHTEKLDNFFWLYSGFTVWIPLVAMLLFVTVYLRTWKEILIILLALGLVVALCDQFSSGFCKPFFARLRPTHHPDFMNDVLTVNGYKGGLYGFISSHACNSFGVVTFFALVFRNRLFTWSLYIWATLNAYSRIYLGVHFISDIIAGALAGMLFGWLVYKLYQWARIKLLSRSQAQVPSGEMWSHQRVHWICYTFFATVAGMGFYSIIA